MKFASQASRTRFPESGARILAFSTHKSFTHAFANLHYGQSVKSTPQSTPGSGYKLAGQEMRFQNYLAADCKIWFPVSLIYCKRVQLDSIRLLEIGFRQVW